jgi:hypothetical protein
MFIVHGVGGISLTDVTERVPPEEGSTYFRVKITVSRLNNKL